MSRKTYKQRREQLIAEYEILTGYSPIVFIERTGDSADRSFALTTNDDSATIAEAANDKIIDILYALEKLRPGIKGIYGRCEYCSKIIPERRLDSIPSARYCLTHQEEVEKRKINPKDTIPCSWLENVEDDDTEEDPTGLEGLTEEDIAINI